MEERENDDGKVESDRDELENDDAGEAKDGAEVETEFDDDGLVWDYYDNDVLSGRGAWVNAHRVRQFLFHSSPAPTVRLLPILTTFDNVAGQSKISGLVFLAQTGV